MKLRSDPFSDRYKLLGNELGRGKFAVVKQCVEIATGQAFAAKIMRKQRKGQDCRADIVHEMSLLELARPCSRVIGLHDAYETHSEITLVLEFAAGGEIFHQCFGEDDEVFSEQNTVRLMRQILEGVVFMHQCNIVHLDLKPQNILLTSAVPLGDIKIADLGLSRRVSSVAELREILGTPEYVAPEILDYEPITTATDMWSIGVLAYVMLTGTSPFLGEGKQETFLNISLLHVDYSPSTFTGVSQTAVDFIQTLLIKKPELRATAEQCLHHPWLQTTFFRSDETPALMTRPSDCLHESALRSPISDTFLDNNHDARLCYCKLLQFSPATPEDQRGLAL